MTDLYDVPEPTPQSQAEEQARRSRSKTWVAIAVVVVVVLVVVCVALFNAAFGGGKQDSNAAVTPAASDGAAQAPVTPGVSGAGANLSQPIAPANADELLLTAQEYQEVELGLDDTPSVTTSWQARLASTDPAECAPMVETVTGAPAGFASSVAKAGGQEAFVQRVYVFDSAAAATAALKEVEGRAVACQQFRATGAGEGPTSDETFGKATDDGQIPGISFDRVSKAGSVDRAGWQRTMAASNVVVEVEYLGKNPSGATHEEVSSLFATVENRLIDAANGALG